MDSFLQCSVHPHIQQQKGKYPSDLSNKFLNMKSRSAFIFKNNLLLEIID